MIFFFGWLLHGSTSPLSGRSPFCQLRKGKRCRCNIGYKQSNESNGAKIKKTPAKPRCSLPESARGRVKVACSSNDQSRARGRKPRARMLTVRKEGTACVEGRVGLHNLKNAHMILKSKRHSNALPGAIGFFLAGCCMAQLRCPGGRPSVSYEWVKMSQNHWI